MNSLTLGFLYVVGFSWALCETCVMASNGNSVPIVLYTIYFLLVFSILGCARVSDRAVEIWGGIFAVMLAVGLVLMAVNTISAGAMVLGAVKMVFAAGFVIAGAISLLGALAGGGSSKASSH